MGTNFKIIDYKFIRINPVYEFAAETKFEYNNSYHKFNLSSKFKYYQIPIFSGNMVFIKFSNNDIVRYFCCIAFSDLKFYMNK